MPADANVPSDLLEQLVTLLEASPAAAQTQLEALCAAHPEHAESMRDWVGNARRAQAALDADERVHASSTAARLARLKARPPLDLSRYSIEGEVARGGMGAVFRVRDEEIGRRLAMKVILGKAEAAGGETPAVDPQLVERFLDEAQVTGQLDHPGVVPVHELGLDRDGRVYFTMRLVKGQTVDEVFALAREEKDGWTRTRALEVVLKICDTMAYAHEKGVLHRDLKPANVMVGRFGEVYVMDWGLAKVLGAKDVRDLRIRPASSVSVVRTDRAAEIESDPDSPLITMDGAVVGTPSYMPPEQAEGRVEELGPQADVYAIGAMLYQLLTGWQPYVKPGARMSPYTVLRGVIEGAPKPVHAIDGSVPAALVAVCEKAMARDLGARYADVTALAGDLRAYLEQRVVSAYRMGALVELSLWVRRNRALAASLVAVFLVAVVGVVVSGAFAREAGEQARSARWEAYFGNLAAAESLLQNDEVANARARLQAAPEEHRGWEWGYLHAALDNSLSVLRHEPIVAHAFTPDGPRILVQAEGEAAQILDAETGKATAVLRGSTAELHRGEFSRDAFVLVTVDDQATRTWDVRTGELRARLPVLPDLRIEGSLLSQDGERAFLVGASGHAQVFDTATGGEIVALQGEIFPATGPGSVEDERGIRLQVAFSPDGTLVVAVVVTGVATVWDVTTGERKPALALADDVEVNWACFSADGALLATACREDRTARVWSPETGKQLHVLPVDARVTKTAFGPPGGRRDWLLAMPSFEGTAHLWRHRSDEGEWEVDEVLQGAAGILENVHFAGTWPSYLLVTTGLHDKIIKVWHPYGDLAAVLRGHEAAGIDVSTDSGSLRVMTSSVYDETLRLWDAARSQRPLVLQAGDAGQTTGAFSADGARLLTCCDIAVLWDVATGEEVTEFGEHGDTDVAAFSVDGTRVVTAHWADKSARVWRAEAEPPKPLILAGHEQRIRSVCFSPDGRRVLSAAEDGTARLWNAETGEQVAVLDHGGVCETAAFSPDGATILTTGEEAPPRLWRVDGQELIAELVGHLDRVSSARFSPDGGRVLTASHDETARLWSATTGALLVEVPAEAALSSAEFSPDGTRVVTTYYNPAVFPASGCIWDAASGALLAEMQGHEDAVFSARFSPDGTRILTGAWDGTARIWDAVTGAQLLVLRGHEDRWVRSVAFSPDGTRVVTCDSDAQVRIWDSVPLAVRARER